MSKKPGFNDATKKAEQNVKKAQQEANKRVQEYLRGNQGGKKK